ncbi:hypothetical protein [Actinoallomurus sp. CA-142502]|uniref:hypothetical protein n=1 Tax=Actinoallomurus sp. CA-142502 TaxID=3239885 RepID=UPI003D92FB45
MRKFDTPHPITVVLNVPAGRVQLIAADRTDTTIEIQPANPAKNRDVKAAEQTTAEYTDGVLKIQAPAKNQYLSPSGSIEVTINLPAGSHIQATAASTELHTTGRLGDITIAAAAGVSATLDAGTTHGRVSNALTNDGTPGLDIHATTTHGDITAHSL